jgi:hypothetical protein
VDVSGADLKLCFSSFSPQSRASMFMKGAASEDESSDDERVIVKSAKDKR